METKKLLNFILSIIIICSVSIVIILIVPFSNSFKDGVIAEIIGGGILGTIVAGVFYYLEESDEYQANKSKALSFYMNKLLLDINEAKERGPSIWNLSGLNKFYFDGSHINPLFDVYQSNFNLINDFAAYFPKNKLIKKYNEFYKLTRKGYVLGEKLENLIRQYVRTEHHKLDLISASDISMVMFLKGKLSANLSEAELIKHIGWNTVPKKAIQFTNQLGSNPTAKNLLKDINEIRNLLIKFEKQIFKLAN